jgi:hypothetical protein
VRRSARRHFTIREAHRNEFFALSLISVRAKDGQVVTTVMIVGLACGCAFLGMRLHAAKSENSALRASIVQLKRRLSQRS